VFYAWNLVPSGPSQCSPEDRVFSRRLCSALASPWLATQSRSAQCVVLIVSAALLAAGSFPVMLLSWAYARAEAR
jgi:hypothetical protein